VTPLSRRPVRIGRAEREYRDDRFFIVATEDTHAPKQYFSSLSLPRVKVLVLETPEGTGQSAPDHVLDRLRAYQDEAQKRREVQDDDQFWMMMDTDHHIEGRHKAGFLDVLRAADNLGFHVAISNPSFELWLLLHHVPVEKGDILPDGPSVVSRLQEVLHTYRKDAIQPERFGYERVPAAISRARALEETPDRPKGYWPEELGTRVYVLMEALGFVAGVK
jgi:hypothetical protein